MRKIPKVNLKNKEETILAYQSFVKFIANKLSSKLPSYIQIDDLISVGYIGLLDALDRFNPSKGIQFKTYAEYRIKGAMLDEIRALSWVPRLITQKNSTLDSQYKKLEKELKRPPTNEEVADYLNININDFYKLLNEIKRVNFIDISDIKENYQLNDDDLALLTESEKDPYKKTKIKQLKEVLHKGISLLSERERKIIYLRVIKDLEFRLISDILNFSESRICQIYNKSIKKLREFEDFKKLMEE